MSAVWSEDPRAPIVINISIAQKAAIVDRAPRLLIEFDLTCGDFWFRTHPYVRFHVLQYPDLIHPRAFPVTDPVTGVTVWADCVNSPDGRHDLRAGVCRHCDRKILDEHP